MTNNHRTLRGVPSPTRPSSLHPYDVKSLRGWCNLLCIHGEDLLLGLPAAGHAMGLWPVGQSEGGSEGGGGEEGSLIVQTEGNVKRKNEIEAI